MLGNCKIGAIVAAEVERLGAERPGFRVGHRHAVDEAQVAAVSVQRGAELQFDPCRHAAHLATARPAPVHRLPGVAGMRRRARGEQRQRQARAARVHLRLGAPAGW